MTVEKAGRIQPWLVAFGALFALFHILPAFMDCEIQNRLWAADIFDLLTPFVVVFLGYRIHRILSEGVTGSNLKFTRLLFIFGAVTFVEGHGMHLSANAVARHLVDQVGSPVYRLNYFFDEILGHLLWDSGTVILAVGFVVLGIDSRQRALTVWQAAVLFLAAAMFGFTYFANAVEGQTTPLTLPIAFLFLIWIAVMFRRRRVGFLSNPTLLFFLCGFAVALIFFSIWFVWQGGLPQFSEAGIL